MLPSPNAAEGAMAVAEDFTAAVSVADLTAAVHFEVAGDFTGEGPTMEVTSAPVGITAEVSIGEATPVRDGFTEEAVHTAGALAPDGITAEGHIVEEAPCEARQVSEAHQI